MKRLSWVWLFLAGVFYSCQAVLFADDLASQSSSTSKQCKLTVEPTLRSLDRTDDVRLLVYDDQDNLVTTQRLDSLGSSWSLSLPTGDYCLVAWAGIQEFNIPETPKAQYVVCLPTCNYLSHPIYRGTARISLNQTKQKVQLAMVNQMAALSFQLQEVPDDVTGVQIQVSSPCNQFQLDGQVSKPSNTLLTTKQQATNWVTDTVYVLPTLKDETTISITMQQPTEAQTYSHSYMKGINSNVPYFFRGSYQDGINLEGSLVVEDWKNQVAWQFTFGPGASDENQALQEEYTVEEFPEPLSWWEDHLVVQVEETETTAQLLLLSRDEWTDVCSGYHATDSLQAKSLASTYREGDLINWQIPDKNQALLLKTVCGGSLDFVNWQIIQQEGTPITAQDDSGKNVRYLCDQGKSTYVYAVSSSFAKAGAKTTYRLRLVKTVQVRLADE